MRTMTLKIECDSYLWMDSNCYLVAALVADARVLLDLYCDYSNCPWNLQITLLIMDTMKKYLVHFLNELDGLASWHQYRSCVTWEHCFFYLLTAATNYYYLHCPNGFFCWYFGEINYSIRFKTNQNKWKQQLSNYDYYYATLAWIFCTLRFYLFFFCSFVVSWSIVYVCFSMQSYFRFCFSNHFRLCFH